MLRILRRRSIRSRRFANALIVVSSLTLSSCEMDGFKSPWTKVVGISYWETRYGFPTRYGVENDWQNVENDWQNKEESSSIGVYEMTYFVIRWGHDGLLDGPDSSASAARRGLPSAVPCEGRSASPQEYEIVVTGFVGPASQGLLERLKQKSYLEPQLLRQKVRPSRVVVESNLQALTLRFFFRRSSPSGPPIIDARESAVTFVCAGGSDRLKAMFNPKEMACPDGTLP